MDYIKNLKPNQLRLIIQIADYEQLQVAADNMAMSQPAASRMLSEVERAADTKIFERHPKGMTLTPAGKAFVRHARSIADSYDNLSAEVSAVKKGTRGEVRIGSVTGPAVRSLVPAILKSKELAPDMEFTIGVGPSTELVRGLAERRFDFIIARLPSDYDSRFFNVFPGRGEAVSLIVRGSHPLAHQPDVELADLRDYEWVIQERGSPIREALEDAFHRNNVPVPDKVTNSSSMLIAMALLEQTDCIAPFAEEVASLLSSDTIGSNLRTIDLKAALEVEPYYVISNKGVELSSAAENVMRELLGRI